MVWSHGRVHDEPVTAALEDVLKDPGGEPLDRLLRGPMELEPFLRLAGGIAKAVGEVHGRDLVHKDVKPSNILVNGTTGAVKLTGFGIASRRTRERQAPEPPETIAGTLAYMAPEQTGRMNRSIDSRSDLYSLGITLYQMLTGSLPFTASDPMEWVHCHIARKAVTPAARLPNVPAALSAIVMKLLAKTAEERYQTAIGLENDLTRCLTQWETQGRIDEFALGERDTPDRLLIPERLYGRTCAIETLLAAFDRVMRSGTPELVLVSGYSGTGKSSVVNELHKVLVPPRGLFASGKFDQYKRDIPYWTLAQAFQSLVRPLLSKSDAELASWRDALREALGPNGQLMVDLVPQLKLIIGEQPAVPDLPSRDAQRRFQLAFRRFVGVFARPEHPLTLFFDDLQWLDGATLDLLEDLLTQPDVQHLLVIGAYRDSEVDAAHPLARKLQAIRNTGAKIEEIALAPLACEHLGQLLGDALRREPKRVARLAQLVHEKTGGNPFFAIQFISALAEAGLLRFDHDAACWSWNLDRIRAEGYTDNVVELMVAKLARLPGETQAALRQLACVGNAAEVTMLMIAFGTSEAQVHADLSEAVRLELVERHEGAYKFVHDRVQEAAYSLIPEASRAEAHLRIGRLLAAQTPLEKREEAIFEIVNQLNRGAPLIIAQDEREQLAELNLVAGKRAKSSTAYAAAQTYITAGCALLPEDRWEHCHALAFSLEFHLAECEFLIGALAAAENRLAMLSARAGRLVDFAAVTCLRASLYATLDRSDRSVEICLDYLRQVGIQWSAHPTSDEVRQEYEWIWQQIGDRPIEELADLPLMTDPECRATLDVLAAVLMPARITDDNLCCLTVSRMANLSLAHGNSDGSCIAYVWVGSMIAGPRFGDYQAAFQFGQLGYDLVEQRGLTRFQAGTYMSFGNVLLPWTRHIRTARDPLRRAFEAAKQSGDLNFAASCCSQLNTNLIAAGDPLDEVQGEAERGLAFGQKMRFGIIIDVITGQLKLIRTLRGLTPTFGSFDEEGFDEHLFERHLADSPVLALAEDRYWIRKLQARFFAGSYASAIVAAANAERLLWISWTVFERAEYHFYAALARAASCSGASAAEQAQFKEALAADYRLLQAWADNCPENFANRAALVAAEIARLEGRELDAERLYEQAIRSARANGFIHNEALANELAARFYAARGFEEIAHLYLGNARRGYLLWGADGKVRQLDQLHPRLRRDERAPGPMGTIAAPVEHLDLATVLKVSQAVSGEIVQEKLLEILMRTAIEQAGAERGVLVLSRWTEQRIAAQATTGGDGIVVQLHDEAMTAAVLPESVVQYVVHTKESVILDDAAAQNPFSADPYIREHHARSILCMPLLNQGQLTGALYLENSLTSGAFAPAGIAALRLLASQAAISLENTRLYRDLTEREARIRRLVDANIIGIFIWDFDGRILEANEAFLHIVGFDHEDLAAGRIRWTDLTPEEWRDRDTQLMQEHKLTGTLQPFEKEYFRKDGSRVRVLIGVAAFEESENQGVAFVLDLTERKRAEERLRVQHTVAQILAEAATIEEAAPRILLAIGECLAWDVGVLWRVDRRAEALRCVEFWHKASIAVPEFERVSRESAFGPGLGLPGRVWSSLKPEYVPDVVSDENFPRGPIAKREELHAALAFPILVGREALGVIEFFSPEIRQPDQEMLNVLATIGSQIGQFIERKQAEEALSRSEAHLAEAQRLSHTGAVRYNGTAILYASEETFHIWGFDPAQGLPSREVVFQRIHPGDRDWLNAEVRRAVNEKKRRFSIGYRIVMPNGTVKHLETIGQPVFSARAKLFEIFAIQTDVTDRKRAEDALRRSQAYLAEAQRLSRTGSFGWRIADNLIVWSQETYRIFEFDPAAKPTLELVLGRTHPDDIELVRGMIERMVNEDREFDFEHRLLLPDGTIKHLHVRTHRGRFESGEVEVVGALMDVTAARTAEEALRRAQAELAHASRVATLGELSASIAHEVHQPLTAIVASGNAAVRWLDREVPERARAIRSVTRMISEANRASQVILRIRELAKKAEPVMSQVDLNSLVVDVLVLINREATGLGVELRSQLAPELPPALGDRVQLQQVLINLVINGIQAMAPVTDRAFSSSERSDTTPIRFWSPSRIRVSGSRARTWTGYSAPSTRPSRTAWAWASRSAARSSKRMAAASGPRATAGRG
jgi:PAS domain S-box-containing protein